MNQTIKSLAKKILPPWLLAFRRHCGGFHRDPRFFAANLLDPDLPSAMYSRIASHLIFPNGVRKSTYPGRNATVLEALFAEGRFSSATPLKVLDIGASFGMDSQSNLEAILKYCPVDSYVLGDLYTSLLYDPETGVVFDEEGNPVQVRLRQGFVNLYFEFKYPIEKIYHLINRYKTAKILKQYQGIKPNARKAITIPLFHPEVLQNPVFKTARLNVFGKIPDKFNLIICINLLQTRYFNEDKVAEGIRNLQNCLLPGGVLVTGVTDEVMYYFAPPNPQSGTHA